MDYSSKAPVFDLAALQLLLERGEFHHATHRNYGPTLFDGLYIYKKDPNGFRGYSLAGSFTPKTNPDIDKAHELVRHTGVSVGCYGQG